MDFKKTIKQMQHQYPTLFYHRCAALNHLFFVNGNGYEWVGGEICGDDYNDKYDENKDYFKGAVAWYLRPSHNIPERLSKKVEAFMLTSIIPEMTHDECMEILHINPDKPGEKVYPICEYAKIANIPDNIKPDWLDGALEAIKWGLSVEHTDKDEKYMNVAEIKLLKIKLNRG